MEEQQRMKIKYELKLSKKYNSFCYGIEYDTPQNQTPEELTQALQYHVLGKTYEFIKAYEELEKLKETDRHEYIMKKLEELKFLWWYDHEKEEFRPPEEKATEERNQQANEIIITS